MLKFERVVVSVAVVTLMSRNDVQFVHNFGLGCYLISYDTHPVVLSSGSITMALLEKLQSGQVYLVKVSASNQMGDGPFSPAVELTVHSAHATGEFWLSSATFRTSTCTEQLQAFYVYRYNT